MILFGYALVTWSVGNGLLPLLPLIAADMGASQIVIGVYLAVSYLALALGTTAAGILSDRVGRRKLIMVVSSLIGSPLILLVSLADSIWQLAILTASAWCVAGMALTLATIQAGLAAGPEQRGSVLGFLAVAAPMGSIIGGLGVGALADAFGYHEMWRILGIAWLFCPLLALFVRDLPAQASQRPSVPTPARLVWRLPFILLVACGILGATGSFLGGFGRSFAMRTAFTDFEITSTVAVSGVVALPFTLLLGWLSDRRGRIPVMILSYGAGALGLVVYASATSLNQFWLAASLVAFLSYVATGVGSALVVDLVDRGAVGRGLAYFGATGWMGAILAFGTGGVIFSAFGLPTGFLIGAGLIALGIALLAAIGLTARAARA